MPLVVGDVAPQEVAHLLRQLWDGPETLIVVSSDLSHYHSYETARRLDLSTAEAIEQGEWVSLGSEPSLWLGSRGWFADRNPAPGTWRLPARLVQLRRHGGLT